MGALIVRRCGERTITYCMNESIWKLSCEKVERSTYEYCTVSLVSLSHHVLYTPRRRNSTIYVSGKQQTRKQTLQELRSEQLHISYSAAKNLQNKPFIRMISIHA